MAAGRTASAMGEGQRRTVRRLRAGLITMLLVIAVGTLGYIGYGYSLLDAIFQTIITVTTVGYGEIHQFSAGAKIFTIGLILAGVGTAGFTFSALIESLVEGYLGDIVGRRRMDQRIQAMHDHVIVCGWGRVGRSITRYLTGADAEVVVIDSAAERSPPSTAHTSTATLPTSRGCGRRASSGQFDLGRDPTPDELARALDISTQRGISRKIRRSLLIRSPMRTGRRTSRP